ncbi:MAG: Nif11-like leader peptide family natural product precursor [Cyanobacteriota bacterium]|nr:Nif11-like leader peptide family natural product precursor [Cyanobacteriota bacterium]
MSWGELERLVEDAEGDVELRTVLRACQNQPQLILLARQLGYHITRVDLTRAWETHQAGEGQQASGR